MELDNDDIFACIFKVTIFILLRVEFFSCVKCLLC